MKILMVSSEAVPFAKTGGLADAVSALSLALSRLGHDVRIVMPRYYSVDCSGLEKIDDPMGVPMGHGEQWCAVYTSVLPGSDSKNPVSVYFLDHEQYFGRDGVYGIPSEPDFSDNPLRFTFLSSAAFQLCRKLQWFPDILHAHDWPSALVPVFLKYRERKEEFLHTHSVFTIHNLGYQGVYDKSFFLYTGLDWNVFTESGFEDWDKMNMLKAALISADKLTTVSPTYAEETKTQTYGFRMNSILTARSSDYTGILNGIDEEVWNPEKDTLLPATYNYRDLSGKRTNKIALQKEFSLSLDPDIPVIGMVTRLTEQKGVGELFGPAYGSAWSICSDMKLQMVLLGSGEEWCEKELKNLSAKLPNFKVLIGYSEKTSHLIEAGSDFFLMPSRYEPCGLNQMYSLAYGTPPIVRNTGGLADTVENYNQETGSGTGFVFEQLSPRSIYDTVGWAVWAYYNRPAHIESMRVRGMQQNFSWKQSAKKYTDLYKSFNKNTDIR